MRPRSKELLELLDSAGRILAEQLAAGRCTPDEAVAELEGLEMTWNPDRLRNQRMAHPGLSMREFLRWRLEKEVRKRTAPRP